MTVILHSGIARSRLRARPARPSGVALTCAVVIVGAATMTLGTRALELGRALLAAVADQVVSGRGALALAAVALSAVALVVVTAVGEVRRESDRPLYDVR